MDNRTRVSLLPSILFLLWFRVRMQGGKPCVVISPRALSIAWINDDRYWDWIVYRPSSFGEVARLKSVCWLNVRGKLEWKEVLTPNCRYTVLFRVKLASEVGWQWSPVELSLTTTAGVNQRCSRSLVGLNRPAQSSDGWMELEAGSFFIPVNSPRFEVQFSLTQRSRSWKEGLLIDSIKIIPSCFL